MNRETIAPLPVPRRGLSALNEVQLNERHRHILEFARTTCGGPGAWRHRKLAEVGDLLALAQISGRLRIEWLDVAVDLRAVVELRVTVPCLRRPDAALEIAPRAVLGLLYRQEVMILPQPGYSLVQILSPPNVWHPNVAGHLRSGEPAIGQVLCLGPSLPVGIPLKEILLAAYAALTFLTIQMDFGDAAGVMNPAAAEWWQANAKKIPLSREPFLVNSEAKL